MRGVGGPLLCISDLLSDVGEENPSVANDQVPSDAAVPNLPASHFPKLFQESLDKFNTALEGSDHSWTAHTLKLCSALETANKLVNSANFQVSLLSKKVKVLERIVDRRDSAIKAAKTI